MSEPRRIAHLDTGRELRGGQVQLLMLARGLRARGHRQWIVCPEGSTVERRAPAEGFSVFALPAYDLGHTYGILELRGKIRQEGIEILHAHDGRGQTLAWLASVGLPVLRVASRRVTFQPRRSLDSRWKYGHTCHAVIAVSNYVKNLIVTSGVRNGQIVVIPDGCEIPAALPESAERARVRQAWGVPPDTFVVGQVGAFTPEKGQDITVEAALFVRETHPRICWLLAGERNGAFARQVEARARAAKDSVRLLGYVESLADFCAGLDLFILPSKAEGLGSSALVAMAHGLAVVASRVGGVPEIVEDGKTGWLVEPGSPAALAEAVARAASEPERLGQMGLAGREKAKSYSSDIMVERTESLYDRLFRAGGIPA
jgi:glycosyltransferase involved in cell wall biosynthesis